MKSESKSSFCWIRNCVNSSTNGFHLEGCKILIELFEKKFGNRDGMVNDLLLLLQEKETFLIVEV